MNNLYNLNIIYLTNKYLNIINKGLFELIMINNNLKYSLDINFI